MGENSKKTTFCHQTGHWGIGSTECFLECKDLQNHLKQLLNVQKQGILWNILGPSGT